MKDLEAKRASLAAKVVEARRLNREIVRMSGELELLKLDILELDEELNLAVQAADRK